MQQSFGQFGSKGIIEILKVRRGCKEFIDCIPKDFYMSWEGYMK